MKRIDSRHVPKLLPLIYGEDAADRQQHHRIRLFQAGAGLGDLIDLGGHLRLHRLVGLHQRLQDRFLFLQVSVQIDELQAMILEDLLDFRDLIVANADSLHEA
jgi:hypothetical protein